MKVQILNEAERDLLEGFWFYEAQEVGLGDYFLDTLFSDIDSRSKRAGHNINKDKSPYQERLKRGVRDG